MAQDLGYQSPTQAYVFIRDTGKRDWDAVLLFEDPNWMPIPQTDGCLMLYNYANNPPPFMNDFDDVDDATGMPYPRPQHAHAELGLGAGGPTPNDLLIVRSVADPLP